MPSHAWSWRFAALAFFLWTALIAGCSGSRSATDGREGEALHARFPEHAAAVLQGGEAFVAGEDGFVRAGEDRGTRLAAVLPAGAGGAIRFRATGGFEVRVREAGIEGDGAIVAQAVAYRRAGGTSYWAVSADGFEEWLHLEAGVARRGEVAARWDVEGGTVREAGSSVEVLDDAGTPRLRVTAPAAWAFGGRSVEARLTAAGARIELRVDAEGEEVLVDPMWTSAGSLAEARGRHTATLLASGEVLVAGGFSFSTRLASAEIYDPATNAWSPAASMAGARQNHTATLLQSGKVLVAGGSNTFTLATAELYDPATNTWSAAATMNHARYQHTATPLANGNVLVTGGFSVIDLNSAEVYDPASNTWSQVATMTNLRKRHTATLLPSGSVLVAGGSNNSAGHLASAEIYDPVANTWTAVASMTTARHAHTATLLPSGKVLITGGHGNASAPLSSVEVYDPATDTWSQGVWMSTGREEHTATPLAGGDVLVVAGHAGDINGTATTASAEIYHSTSDTWSPAASLSTARLVHTATLLAGGDVLVVGGQTMVGSAVCLASAERYGVGATGAPCSSPGDCVSGFCADGVCCTTACDESCGACSVAAGSSMDGTCTLLTGLTCDDGNACTQTDTCQGGVCIGAIPVICMASDECHDAGTCNPTTGACSNPAKPDGTGCTMGTCQGGTCVLNGGSGGGGAGGSGGGGGASSSSSSSAAGGAGGAGGSSTGTGGTGGGGSSSSSATASGSGGAGAAGASSGTTSGGGSRGDTGDCACRLASRGAVGGSALPGAWLAALAALAAARRRVAIGKRGTTAGRGPRVYVEGGDGRFDGVALNVRLG